MCIQRQIKSFKKTLNFLSPWLAVAGNVEDLKNGWTCTVARCASTFINTLFLTAACSTAFTGKKKKI